MAATQSERRRRSSPERGDGNAGASAAASAAEQQQEGGLSFPLKLHAMLEEAENKGFTDVVAWQPGDKSFRVNDVNKFSTEIMPRYFNQTKFKSFQRQLNIYGYRRIQHGPLKGGYVHKCFIRGRPELSTGVVRRSNNAAKAAIAAKVMEIAAQPNPNQVVEQMLDNAGIDDEPIRNFMGSVDFGSANLQGILDRIFRSEDVEGDPTVAGLAGQHNSRHHRYQESSGHAGNGHIRSASGFVFNLDDEPRNEGDADMAAIWNLLSTNNVNDAHAEEDAALSDAEQEQETEEQLSERIFPLKLHKMLEHAERDGIQHIVSWVNNGTGFKVHNSKLFTEQVMPMYFDQTKYESFRRQLNLYMFSRVSRGPQRGVYSHPMFISGRRDLLGSVTRKINAGGDGAKGFVEDEDTIKPLPDILHSHHNVRAAGQA